MTNKTLFGEEDGNREGEVAQRLDRVRHAADDKVRMMIIGSIWRLMMSSMTTTDLFMDLSDQELEVNFEQALNLLAKVRKI